jgi:hypothetical protein
MKSISKVAWTRFFDFDISASRSTRSSGNGATPFVVSKPVGTSMPVSALNSCACPESGEPTSPRCSIAPQGIGGSSTSVIDLMSKKTKKRRIKARRNKANHGKRPNAGRR